MNCGRNHSKGWKRLKPFAAALLFAGLSNTAFAEEDRKPPKPPIILESTGAYEVGGKVITKPGDPSQTLSCDHGYVEYFIPVKRRSVGLIMWHSSSTKVWENRWDGGEGYKSIFLRKGYPVYLWDGPRVGRANWSCEPITYTPAYFDHRNFAAWRFGLTYPNWHPGLQFPAADQEAWDQATRARYDEFDTLENALLQAETGGQAIDKIGPVVAVTNSAGGWRALLSALKAKSDHMKGIVAYETPGFVFPEGEGARAQAERAVRSQFRAAGRVHEADEVSDPDGVRRLHRLASHLGHLGQRGTDLLRYRQSSRRRLRGLAAPRCGSARQHTHRLCRSQ